MGRYDRGSEFAKGPHFKFSEKCFEDLWMIDSHSWMVILWEKNIENVKLKTEVFFPPVWIHTKISHKNTV